MSYPVAAARGRGSSGGGAAPSWLPTDYANLAVWVDPSDATKLYTDAGSTNVSADGQSVYQANDKGGNGRHFVMSTSGQRPLYKTNIQNGLSVLRFDGSDDFMISTAGSYAAKTLIVVWRSLTGSPATAAGILTTRTGGNAVKATASDYQLGFTHAADTSKLTGLTDGTIAAAYNNGGSSLNISNYSDYFTGAAVGTITDWRISVHQDNGVSAGAKSFVLAADCFAAIGSRHANMDVGDVLILTDIPSAGDLNLFGAYLEAKWAGTWNDVS